MYVRRIYAWGGSIVNVVLKSMSVLSEFHTEQARRLRQLDGAFDDMRRDGACVGDVEVQVHGGMHCRRGGLSARALSHFTDSAENSCRPLVSTWTTSMAMQAIAA